MIFDLRGKRRRAVQGTYLTLAILMAAGLVLFGIGSGISGFGDIFGNGGGGSNHGNSILQKQIDDANKRLAANPQDQGALKQLISTRYRLAVGDSNETTGAFGAQGQQQLRQAAATWQRYRALTPHPDSGIATIMVQAYAGLNEAEPATQAAEIVAAAQPSSKAYLQVVQYASFAHDQRAVAFASRRALQLAPSGERATVKQAIQQAKAAGAGQPGQAGAAGTP